MTLRQGRVIGTHGSDTAGGYGIADIDRPQRREPLDLDAIAEFNAAQKRARADYYARTQPPPSDYARRIAGSEKSRRYRARMKEQK